MTFIGIPRAGWKTSAGQARNLTLQGAEKQLYMENVTGLFVTLSFPVV